MSPDEGARLGRVFDELGLAVLERGWLSSNNIVVRATRRAPSVVVDTGYVGHAAQTASLLRASLGGALPERVINTHLHSDHCGGNALLQHAGVGEVWIPEASMDAVGVWDETRLSYRATGQRCARFSAHRGLRGGETVSLGDFEWNVVDAPGHDPHAVMLFQPASRVLISADALWESRLSIVFPELEGHSGFGEARTVLDTIERLRPDIVIPGHGRPFTEVGRALQWSRLRIAAFIADPAKHVQHAERALTMFHVMEMGVCEMPSLITWLAEAPIFRQRRNSVGESSDVRQRARVVVQRLVAEGRLIYETQTGAVSIG